MEKINWADHKGYKNPVLEAYRSISANLRVKLEEQERKIIEFTSLMSETEKSRIVAGIGIAMAQSEKKVLLIDGNLTAPVQHFLFGLQNQGILDCVVTGKGFSSVIQHCPEQSLLDILACGSATFDSKEIFISDAMQLFLVDAQKEYDFILLDMPSMAEGADALVLAKKSDGVVLVLNAGIDRLNALIEAKNRLEQSGADVLGCILDKGCSKREKTS